MKGRRVLRVSNERRVVRVHPNGSVAAYEGERVVRERSPDLSEDSPVVM